MVIARQSTARTVIVGPVLDASGVAVTDGVVGDLKIAKNGGAPAALNGSATLTHRHTGFYSLALTASDLDTVGQAEVTIDDTVNAMPMKVLTVVEEAPYDAIFAASALGYVANAPVNVAQLGGDAQSLTDLKDFADAGYDPSTNKVQGVVLTDTVTTYTGNTPQTGDAFARLGAPAGASVSADIAAIEAQTDDIGAAGAGLTAVPWNAAWDAEVQSEVTDALNAYDPPTRAEATSDVNSVLAILGTPAGASMSADIAAIEAQTDDIGVAGAGLTALASAANLATVAGYLDTEIAAIKAVTDALPNAGALTSLAQASVLGTPAGASIAADIAAIEAQTDDIGVAGDGLTAVPWNSAWDAEVQSEVQDAIELNHLDHLLAVTYDPASKPGAADALLNELVENDGGVARYTANALEQGPSGGGGVADWSADERTAIRSILGIPASGTTPDDPAVGILDTIRDKVDAVDDFVDTEVAAIKAKTDNLPSDPADASDIAAAFATVNATLGTPAGVSVSADLADIEGKVDDLETRLTSTRAGYLDNLSAGAVALEATAQSILTDTAEIGAAGAGLTALATQASVNTIDDFIDTEVAAIKAKTDNLPSDPADASDIAALLATITGYIDTEVASILAAVDTEVAAIKTVTDQFSAAQAEPSAAPAANATPLEKLAWLAALARNKVTQTATTQTLRNDADSGDIATAAVSDDGTTFTRAEWA